MRRSDHQVMAQESRRAKDTARRKIGSGVPEGLEGQIVLRLHCGAVAGKSAHGPMT